MEDHHRGLTDVRATDGGMSGSFRGHWQERDELAGCVNEGLAVFGGEGDVGEVGTAVPGVYGIRTDACCADPTGDCELIKVAFDVDVDHVFAGCVDPALDVQGADLAAWLDAEADEPAGTKRLS